MANKIYTFSGTGNCLKLSQDIAVGLEDCEIIMLGGDFDSNLECTYDRIGFVFPVYFQGLPLAVRDAIRRIDFSSNKNTYYFAAATYGALAGNALAQLAQALAQKGVVLQYAEKLLMFSNCVTLYNMSAKVEQKTRRSDENARPIIEAIQHFEVKKAPLFRPLLDRYYRYQISKVNTIDYGFHTNDDCTSCGICAGVCPAGNIQLKNGRPAFQHQCEHCTACIQYCPRQAINYKNKTQKRRRYHHPAIDYKVMKAARG